MGRYKRKSSRQSWDENQMRQAILAVRQQKMGWLLASKTYNVPFTTLRRRASKEKGWEKGYLGGHKATFNQDLEREIVEHLEILESRLFGMTTVSVRKLAYEIAVAKRIPHRFSHETKMAGWDWLRGFRKRNPTISLRIPESTSAARARAFNKPQIRIYFEKLTEVITENNLEPNEIWNIDESGLSTVPSQNCKIFATKGRKQVGVLTSAERGQHLTVVCCMNAVGTFVPPGLIFPRKNMKHELMDNAPVGAVGFTQENGWMNSNVFIQWMKHFVKFVKPTTDRKVLLLLDGHGSHKSLEVIEYAKSHGIILFCFPPHCTHRVQPLDVSFYGPLNTYYNQALNNWIRSHPGRTVTHYQVAGLFKEAYDKAATLSNAQSGFLKTGIYPLNADIFPDHLFAPAETTDTPEETLEVAEDPNVTELEPTPPNDNPSCSREISNLPPVEIPSSSSITVAEISPLPVATQIKRKTNRKRGKYGILNSTPEVEAAKQIIVEKRAKELRKSARKIKKKVFIEEKASSESSDEPELFVDDDEDDAACIFCNELFSTSRFKETWIKCQLCAKWSHAECAGVDKKQKVYMCDICRF